MEKMPSIMLHRNPDTAVSMIHSSHMLQAFTTMRSELRKLKYLLEEPSVDPGLELDCRRWLGSERFLFNYVTKLANASDRILSSDIVDFFNRPYFLNTDHAPPWMASAEVFFRYKAAVMRWDDVNRLERRWTYSRRRRDVPDMRRDCCTDQSEFMAAAQVYFGHTNGTPIKFDVVKGMFHHFDLYSIPFRGFLARNRYQSSGISTIRTPDYWLVQSDVYKQRPFEPSEMDERVMCARRETRRAPESRVHRIGDPI